MTKAFHALDYSSASSPHVETGVGDLTEARVSTIYLPDDAGIWQSFISDVAGRVYANLQWWLYGGPAGTNQITRSFDLVDAAWAETGADVAVLDAVGLRGDANGASTLTDNDAGALEFMSEVVVIPDDSNVNVLRIFIDKDSDETRFPEFAIAFSGGTGQSINLGLNTKTGSSSIRVSTGTVAAEVNDVGLWWEVLVSVANNSTGNTSASVQLFPARGLTLGGSSVVPVGSIIVGNVELHLDKTIAQVRGSTPIFTAGSTVTVNATDLSFDDANHADTEGAYYMEYKNVGITAVHDGGLVMLGADGRIIFANDGNRWRSDDGPNIDNGPGVTLAADDTEYKTALAYGSSLKRLNTDDAWGVEGDYDGEFNNSLGKMNVLQFAVTGVAITVMLMRNLRRYDMTYDEAIEAIPDMMNGIFPDAARNYLAITRRTSQQMRPKQRMQKPRSTTRGFFE